MTSSLSNFIFSLFAGGTVLTAIFTALAIVSANDRILRE